MVAEGVAAVALHVEHAQHIVAKNKRHGQLGLRVGRRQGRRPIARLAAHVVDEHRFAVAGHPGDDALGVIQRVAQPLLLRGLAAGAAAGLIADALAYGVNGEEVHEGIAQPVVQELHDLVEQRVQVEQGDDLGTDLAHQQQLLALLPLHRQLLGGVQSRGRLDGQTVEKFALRAAVGRAAGPCHLQHA